MGVKKNKKTNQKLQYLKDSHMEVKVLKGKDGIEELFIEGLANANIVDRANERIDPKAWFLDDFKKNPVILLNHGFDVMGGLPIGKAVDIEPTEDGLKVKVKISDSNHGPIPMVRDLIKDGYLSTFSVGFSMEDGKLLDDQFLITKASLYEISVVGVPENQGSTFAVTQKDFKTKSVKQIEAIILRGRGAHVAANVLDQLEALEDGDFEDFTKSMVRRTKRSAEEIKGVMLGTVKADNLFIKKACDYLDVSRMDLLEGMPEVSILKGALMSIEDGGDPYEVLEALLNLKAMDDDKEDDDEDDDKEDEDDEEKKGEGAGGSDSSKESDEGPELKDFEACVNGKIPKNIDDGMDQDEAVAAAIAACQEEKGCDLGGRKAAIYEQLFAAAESYKEAGTWTPIEIKQAQVEGENPLSTPIDTDKDVNEDPHLMSAKQTNVLLGALVNEFQKFFSLMEKSFQPTSTVDTQENTEEVPADEKAAGVDEDLQKRYALAKRNFDRLEKRLTELG